MSKEEKESSVEAVESSTEDSSKKRTLDEAEGDQLEIDLNLAAPLSKKQKRLLRRGKLDLEKLEKKNPKPKPANFEETKGEDESSEKKERPPRIGVWIGNLSFDTTKDDLIRFITLKTQDLPEHSDELSEDEPVKVEEKNIVRVNLPTQGRDSKKIKGFAYIDFSTKNHQRSVINLSEQQLNGRNLLIKNSDSFEGRPNKEEAQLSKNPPSRILFVGNLSFDTTEEMLHRQFVHCGELIKIRMATFEDSGKCKGFAFLDFKDEEGPTKALKDKSCKKLLNRPLRMEFGEDRSKKAPKNSKPRNNNGDNDNGNKPSFNEESNSSSSAPVEPAPIYRERSQNSKPRRSREPKNKPRPISSVALAGAQRASVAIVESKGKKTTF
ncbi:RNA-binding protein [Wickerhamomyces ciferrii]|uniref:RNA-binding protein n=1 Tax=Wickerhamomyces ciferrii (strain ATCC 14091 / BCRC 22168 / CBS 111 / JCM 3599 / NBRC 0793 / NRRL Y-1031 F-60-10) TaxID=1206466 RepID=K0KE10_WICCF|nr:RNA-binding protein [Wickerhamomyces ciferrii]CCH43325.1 RNA-binding protein [Wickerhamomyces ciferrii]